MGKNYKQIDYKESIKGTLNPYKQKNQIYLKRTTKRLETKLKLNNGLSQSTPPASNQGKLNGAKPKTNPSKSPNHNKSYSRKQKNKAQRSSQYKHFPSRKRPTRTTEENQTL